MSLPTLFLNAQDMPVQRVPVTFSYLEEGGYGDDAAPGRWFPLLSDVDGALFVTLVGPGGLPILLPDDADDVAEVATNTRLPTVSRLYGLDGATGADWDRLRTDDDSDETSAPDGLPALRVMGRNRLFSAALDSWQREKAQDGISVAASAARTVATTFGTFVNVNHRTLHIIVGVTVIGADDLTIEIQGRQLFPPFNFYPLLTSLAITSTGTTVLKIGVGFSPIANLTANDMITAVWQVVATPSGVDPITYSINANLGV
jgi:hypothetical protein